MNELETTVAAPFIHSQEGELSMARLLFYYVQDKNWINIDEAKRLVALAERKGLLKRNEKENFVPQPTLRRIGRRDYSRLPFQEPHVHVSTHVAHAFHHPFGQQ